MLMKKYCPQQHNKKLHTQVRTLQQEGMLVISYLNTSEDFIAII